MRFLSKRMFLSALLFFSVFFPSFVWAKVTIDSSFTGTLIVTSPSGEVTLYEAGDTLPDIAANSTIEVFDGSFTMHTEAGDTVSVGCFGDGHSVGGGSSASLSCGENSGTLKVDGTEIPINGVQSPDTAPPTAESDSGGVPTDQDTVPDSRSLQSSPTN